MSIFDSIRKTGFRRGPKRILGGVAGGIAESIGWNVWIVRIVVLLSFLLPVLGWVVYAIIWALTPWQDGSIPVARWLGRR